MTIATRLLRWIDQTGNFLANGDPDSTISARIGYHNRNGDAYASSYWLTLKRLVDWVFAPLDGEGHCQQAFMYDQHEHFRGVSLISGILLAMITVVGCLAVMVVTRPIHTLLLVSSSAIYAYSDIILEIL